MLTKVAIRETEKIGLSLTEIVNARINQCEYSSRFIDITKLVSRS